MKAYDACPDCGTIDRSRGWVRGITKRLYYFCVCQECDNLYYQTYGGQDTKKRSVKVPVKSIRITPEKRDPVPIKGNRRISDQESQYIQLSNDQLPPRKRGKRTTSQARL